MELSAGSLSPDPGLFPSIRSRHMVFGADERSEQGRTQGKSSL